MTKRTEFKVEISNMGPKGFETSVIMELPATWADFNDALHKARIEDSRHCKNEVVWSRRSDLSERQLGRNVNLLELNFFARCLAMLREDQELGFEGLLRMEENDRVGPIPLPRLIDLTFNTELCCVAPGIHSTVELGTFLWETDRLSDGAMRLLDEAEPKEYRESLLAVFGKKYMDDVGGVMTNRGYVERSGELQKVYVPEDTDHLQYRGAPVVLEVRRGCFEGPDDSNGLTAPLDLPTCEEAVRRAIRSVEAAAFEECDFQCVACLIPAAQDMINDVIDEEGDIRLANGFAKLLHKKERTWGEADIVKYKALLEASGCTALEDAMKLMEELDQYDFQPEINSPQDYAEATMKARYPDLPSVLFQTARSFQVGAELMREEHAALTDYGLIRRKDGQPLPTFEQRGEEFAQSMG